MHSIKDWEIKAINGKPTSIKTKKNKTEIITELLSTINLEESHPTFKHDFLHVYEEMKPTIKNLKIEKQFQIVLSTLNIGMTAATNAYSQILKTLKTEFPKQYKSALQLEKH